MKKTVYRKILTYLLVFSMLFTYVEPMTSAAAGTTVTKASQVLSEGEESETPETESTEAPTKEPTEEPTEAPHVHDLVETPAKDATCTEEGNQKYYTCSSCGLMFSDEEGTVETHLKDMVIAALGHTEVVDAAVPATCTETGLTQGSHCSVCNETLVAQETVPALGHASVTDAAVPATCTENGKTEGAHCSVCNEVLVAQTVIPATDHTVVVDAAVPATCTETGLTEGSHCSVCNVTLVAQETVPANGHTSVTDVAVPSTCTETGLTEGSHCSVCNVTLVAQETVPAKGHSMVFTPEVEADEYVAGNIAYYTCTVCGKFFEDASGNHELSASELIIPALGHTHILFVTNAKDPTCTEAGNKIYYTCPGCGKVYSDTRCKNETTVEAMTIPATGHTVVVDEAIPATCTENGKTEGSHCSVCNETLAAQEIVPAFGHTVVVDEAVPATCTEAGLTEGSHCFVCHDILVAQAVVPALGHTVAVDAAVPATCTETGLTEGSHCSVCNEILTAQEIIPAKGHNMVYTAALEAGEYTDGNIAYYTCTVCKKYFEDEAGSTELSASDLIIPSLGHTHHFTVTEAKAATCTEAGNQTYYTCTGCGKVYSDENGLNVTSIAAMTIAATGHTVVNDAAIAPTCTTDGKTKGSHCSVCNEVLVAREIVPALGHTEVTDAAVAATCTTAGKTEGSHCSVCNEVLVAQVTLPALGHTEVIDKAVAATCTTAGKTEGSHCSVCSEVLAAQVTVPALGHTEVTDKAVAATCTKDGKTEGAHCSVCGTVIKAQTTIKAAHTHVVTDSAVAATCTTAGKTEGSHCSDCGTVIKAQTTINALGHKYVEGICSRCKGKIALATPTLSKVENVVNGQKITWGKVTNAVSYIVYRKSGSEDWKRIGTPTATSFTDTTGTSGVTYTYTVRAVCGQVISGYNKTGKTLLYLSSPSLGSVSNAVGGQTFTWSKVTGATGYIVYRKSGTGSWSRIAEITSGSTVSYTDKTVSNGTKYTYTVRATKDSVLSYYYSAGKSLLYVATPTLSSLSNVYGGQKLTWSKISGATGYYVYRKTASTSWSRIAEIKSGSTVTYTDKTGASGTKYTYTVRAVNNSVTSNFDHTGKTLLYLASPTLSSAINNDGSQTVKWGKVSGATGYYVYRKTASTGWSRIAEITSGSTISYTAKNVTSGTTYIYTVRAVNGSVLSNYNSTGISLMYLDAPTIKITNSTIGAIVSWTKVEGAEGYTIYRKENDGNWVFVIDTQKSNLNSTALGDKGITAGSTYYFKICAHAGNSYSAYRTSAAFKK